MKPISTYFITPPINTELTESDISGMGGIYRFKNSWLNFDIVNDRGIIETRISSLYSENFYDLNLINAYLNRRNNTELEKAIIIDLQNPFTESFFQSKIFTSGKITLYGSPLAMVEVYNSKPGYFIEEIFFELQTAKSFRTFRI